MRWIVNWIWIQLRRQNGRWRLWWNLCPECNSDAPYLYDCPVCEYYHGQWPPSDKTKQEWWRRFESELYVPSGYRQFIENLGSINDEMAESARGGEVNDPN